MRLPVGSTKHEERTSHNPKQTKALMERLINLINQQEFKKAEALIRNCLEKNPKDVYMLTQLANVLWNRHKDKEALFYADKAKEIDDEYPLLVFTRARILWSLEEYEQSISEWDKLLNMSEDDMAKRGFGLRWAKSVINDSRYYKADCLFHLYKDCEALNLMEIHIANRKRGVQSNFTKADAIAFYKMLKYSDKQDNAPISEHDYASDRQRTNIIKKLETLAKDKNLNKAIHYLKGICAKFPKEYYCKIMLSDFYHKNNNSIESLYYAKEAFETMPTDPLTIYTYAVALMRNEKYKDALIQFRNLINLGLDYLSFCEHSEGSKWAKKLLRDAQHNISIIQNM